MPSPRQSSALSRLARLLCVASLATGCHGAANRAGKSAKPPAPHPGGLFRNAAAEAGVVFHWGHEGRSPLNIVETLGHGCAFLDYDQDGNLDILLVGNRRLALYRNLGGGRFGDVTAEAQLAGEGDLCGV